MVQRLESGSLGKLSGSAWLVAGLVAPTAWLLAGCSGASGDLMSSVALPSQQTVDFVDGVGVPSGVAGGQSGKLDLNAAQRSYLDALAAAGIHPSSELRALSIGSYVCQAHVAGQSDQAVREYVAPMVRSDLADSHAAAPNALGAIQAETAITEYIRDATDKLC